MGLSKSLLELNVQHWIRLLWADNCAVTQAGYMEREANSYMSDLAEAGLLTIEQPGDRRIKVTLTDLGWKVSAQLRRNRAEGLTLEEFDPKPFIPTVPDSEPLGKVVKQAFVNVCVQERSNGEFTAFDVFMMHTLWHGRTPAEALSNIGADYKFEWETPLGG